MQETRSLMKGEEEDEKEKKKKMKDNTMI